MLDLAGHAGELEETELPEAVELAEALDRLQQAGGSDLLISVGTPPRMRCDGVLNDLDERPLTAADTELMLRSVLSPEQWHELEQNRSLDFAITWRETVRIRGNAYHQRDTLAAAFRLLPLQIPGMEELGIPESVHHLLEQHQGLLLVTGPTGSGKSTTL